MRNLLEGLVPGLPADLTGRILERAEGVPLYAVETLRMLLDRGVLAQEGSRYVLAGAVEDLEVPETLQALAAARLDNLAPGERALLQDAAVLGMSFSAAALAAVAERPEDEVRAVLDGLVTKQVLGRDDDPRSSDPGQYHFLQALLRSIALSTLSRRDRKARHLAAARHLESTWGEDAGDIAEVLASHYLGAIAAEPEAPDVAAIRRRARETLAAAGRRASSLALGVEGAAMFQRAAELAESEVQRASLLSEAGAAAALGDRDAGARLLEEAIIVLDDAGEVEEAAITRVRLAEILSGVNRLEQAGELLARAEPALRDPAHVAEAAALRGRIGFLIGDYATTRQECEVALSIADPRRLAPVIAEAAMNKAIALLYENRLSESGALMELALDVALEADLPAAALRAYFNLGEYRCSEGKLGVAIDVVERGLVLARERGNRPWEQDLVGQRIQILVLAGQWDQALEAYTSLAVAGAGDPQRVATCLLAVVHAARGDRAALEALLAGPDPESEWQELRMMETTAKSLALHATGQPAAAAERVESVLPELAEINRGTTTLFLADAVEILLAAGRGDAAAQLGGRQGVVPPPLLEPPRLHAQARVLIDGGEDEAAEVVLREATERLRGLQTPYLLARCLHDLAALLRRQDRDAEASPLLHEARELFTQLGATVWIERVDALRAPAAA
jgi:tetratricopeptide (TPR) repeat protein